jgi:Tfp pilus assembly protein PilF
VIEQILQADRYLQVDQVEQARGVYQKVVDLDPGNAIAVVGLARCALADGDDHQAHALASKALEIDPENDMARRMEARLSEILATRGEPVERPEAAATPSPREMRPVVTEEPAAAAATQQAGAPSPTPPSSSVPPTKAKEPAVRKSLFDRLMGR